MNTPNQSDSQSNLSRILEKICEIAEKSASGDCIFRGETELHEEPPYCGRVSSNLCREYWGDIEEESFEIEFVQKEILDEAKKYSHKEEFEILTELQHYGSKTNLIDFTTDYLIALFFACDGSPGKNGRVILQKRSLVESFLEQPREPRNRVIAQKSIFVRPPKGYIDPDEVITIESDLKQPMLEHLRNSHDISTETIYNDLHGFITNRSIHESAYTQFHKGMTCQKRGDSAKKQREEQRWYNKAIEHYTEAIRLKPDLSIAYNNRGIVYEKKGKTDLAIADYNRAIELAPENAGAYNNRGLAYRAQNEPDRALQDFSRAVELAPENTGIYSNRGGVYLAQNEPDRALQDFSRAIELDPEDAGAYYGRGSVYLAQDEPGKALPDFSRAIELDPEDAGAYYGRGSVYLAQDEPGKALPDFSRAIELDPANAGVLLIGKKINRGTARLYRAISLTLRMPAYHNRGNPRRT